MPIAITPPMAVDDDVVGQIIAELATQHVVQQAVIPISYTDATGTVVTLNENCVILDRVVVRVTPWNVAPTFTLGTVAAPTLLIKNNQHQLSSSGAGVARIAGDGYRTTASTPLRATWTQNGATAGAGYLIITYMEL